MGAKADPDILFVLRAGWYYLPKHVFSPIAVIHFCPQKVYCKVTVKGPHLKKATHLIHKLIHRHSTAIIGVFM